ncbi:MAG TPA: peptidoglycan DD-metalloendopeptidase family protein [Gammaproteobacteria bacterium]
MRAAPVALLLMIAGCAGSSSSLVEYPPRVHVVQPGETLFGIAWRYGLDYRDLARWNGLDDPDYIRAGQRLRLAPAPDAGRTAAAGGGASTAASPPARSGRQAPAATGSSASRPNARAATPLPSSPPPEWRWPTSGPIVSRFGSGGDGPATGIGIGGREGQAIEAAASGRVVYAGSGLIGYGQLVIIRHNDTYLSAYGYNSRLLVEQGQSVARGQKIAEMGLGPGRQPRLHFEIRRNGVPVDPLQFLAPR